MSDTPIIHRARFSPLLITLAIYIFGVLPFFRPGAGRSLLINVAFSVVMASAVYAVSGTRRALIRASAVVGTVLVGTWCLQFFDGSTLRAVVFSAAGLAIFGGTLLVIREVLRSRTVNGETIQGAICGYLMLALCWSFLYALVETSRPGSFHGLEVTEPVEATRFIYFSFVTLTTLGFGDAYPLTDGAQSLVTLQAVVGQFYLAILVARLVALYTRDQG